MRSVAVVLIIIGALCTGGAVLAEEPAMTAGDLAQLCTGTDTTSKNVCRVYILGATQGISVGMSMADGKTRGGRPCMPDNLPGDALAVLVKEKLGQVTSMEVLAQHSSGLLHRHYRTTK